MSATFPITLRFHGDLSLLLRSNHRSNLEDGGDFESDPCVTRRELREKTAVKDVIEACGVPHTEVDLIMVERANDPSPGAVDLAWLLEEAAEVDIYPAPVEDDVHAWAPRLQSRHRLRFVADGHLGKLARNLRLLGYDTVYERGADDRRLLEIMAEEDRTLLTRDRQLLMYSVVSHGYCPRSTDPEEQTREVLARFHLGVQLDAPGIFSRCLECNGQLVGVPKDEVLAELADEPLTLQHYDEFYRCTECAKIFWKGTHHEKLVNRVARISAMLV